MPVAVFFHLAVRLSVGRPPAMQLPLLREEIYVETASDTVRHEVSIVLFCSLKFFA
jgi:hypothetical protein